MREEGNSYLKDKLIFFKLKKNGKSKIECKRKRMERAR